MIEEIFKDIDITTFLYDLNELLILENNIKLTKNEYFFDMYMIKPSKLLKILINEKH